VGLFRGFGVKISLQSFEWYLRWPMSSAAVELHVGGQTYRVLSSEDEEHLRRLADLVDARLRELTGPGRPIRTQGLLLAAISLAHELEQERSRRLQEREQSREVLSAMLARIDAALDDQEGSSVPEDSLVEFPELPPEP
jgi:cell division protein ZapA